MTSGSGPDAVLFLDANVRISAAWKHGGESDHLVSGDKKHFGPWYGKIIHGVWITAPTELLAVLRLSLP
jgi:hypothetical protein